MIDVHCDEANTITGDSRQCR